MLSRGLHRVVGQPGVLPQQADRLDALSPCQPGEIEVAVEHIHIDASSMRQMRCAHGGEPGAVRTAVIDLVARRGKLHNPVTDSGGMLTGIVRAVGCAFPAAPSPGTRIASLASLTLTPLRLDELGAIDARSNSVRARGTAFLFDTSPWVALPADIPEAVALAALDVAGAPARVRARTRPGDRVLIVGAGNSGSLAAIAAAEAGAGEVLIADIDAARLRALDALAVPGLRTLHADAGDALGFAASVGDPVDLSVSCVDRPGVESACILSTGAGGLILFFSMTTNFGRAALGAEGVGSAVTLEIGNGFYPGHAALVIEMLRRRPALWPLLA
ncbi:MAG: L-erythro-3,5-diaminohexanoate dehydrogenase [Gammaproteobacteria bacterium]|nr:L-erythro-3,5-diaminohexanoate dehydrogenase [Gammaproteobacteria bacterium]MDE2251302.1 L-erythro-3,5-diaminohexanoate dehydrogenase [Gammaproteobacteria bacterium]